jgi:hypothetical protein
MTERIEAIIPRYGFRRFDREVESVALEHPQPAFPGSVRSRHVTGVTAKMLREAIVTQPDRKSYLMTDDAAFFQKLG